MKRWAKVEALFLCDPALRLGYEECMDTWIDTQANPFETFRNWYELAQKHNTFEPTQVTLATVSEQGWPSARVVLLKSYDDQGFCFFTNYQSRKGLELDQQKKAALVFHWALPLHRQIRVQGWVERTTLQESQEYYRTRARGSQIGAWASPQSQPIQGPGELTVQVEEVEERFSEQDDLPCPPFWGGYRVQPLKIEFWEAGEFRLHKRIEFQRAHLSQSWQSRYLAP